MLNYIRAELFKVLHRSYLYITMAVMLAITGVIIWSLWVFNHNGNSINFYSAGSMLILVLSTGLYATILTGDMVFSEQYKCNTLKNEVSYGLSRGRIYCGKLVVQCIVSVVLCLMIMVSYLGLCWLVLPHGDQVVELFRLLGYCTLCALPLWFGAQAITTAMYFNVKNASIAAGLTVVIFTMSHQVMGVLGILVNDLFSKIYNVMLPVPFGIAPNMVGDWGFVGYCFAVGAGWFIASTVVGLLFFRKREIN